MLIASKYEEIWAPEVRDFVFICDSAYTRGQILAMEKQMLNKLKFKVTSPTSHHFLARFIKVLFSARVFPKCCKSTSKQLLNIAWYGGLQASGVHDKKFAMLCMYAVEIAFPDYHMLTYSYSKIAAAAVLISMNRLNKESSWHRSLQKHTGYSEEELAPCARDMLALLRKAGSQEVTLKAVHKKYSNARFLEVANMFE
jgi:cyclin B